MEGRADQSFAAKGIPFHGSGANKVENVAQQQQVSLPESHPHSSAERERRRVYGSAAPFKKPLIDCT
jgi:hypothetical protein